MKIKNIYDLAEGLSGLLDKELSVSTAFKIQKNYNKVVEELKTAEDLRKKLTEKHKGDDKKLNEEFTELLEQKVDVKLEEINLDDLQGVKIKPRTLALIEKIIKE